MPHRDFAENRIGFLSRPEIRITPDTSDSYNRVQSGFYPSSIPYTSSRRASSFAPAKLLEIRRPGFNSCFGFSAREMSATSLRGTDKIDFSLVERRRRRLQTTATSRTGDEERQKYPRASPRRSSTFFFGALFLSSFFFSERNRLLAPWNRGFYTLRLAWMFSTAWKWKRCSATASFCCSARDPPAESVFVQTRGKLRCESNTVTFYALPNCYLTK